MRRFRQAVPDLPARFSRARLPQRGQRVRLWPGWTVPSCARWWDATLGARGDGRQCRQPQPWPSLLDVGGSRCRE